MNYLAGGTLPVTLGPVKVKGGLEKGSRTTFCEGRARTQTFWPRVQRSFLHCDSPSMQSSLQGDSEPPVSAPSSDSHSLGKRLALGLKCHGDTE